MIYSRSVSVSAQLSCTLGNIHTRTFKAYQHRYAFWKFVSQRALYLILFYTGLLQIRIQYLFGFDAIMNVISILPVLGYASVRYQNLIFLRVFRIHRVYRILRLVVKTNLIDGIEVTYPKVRQQLYRIIFLMYMFFFIGAGLIHAYENFIRPGSFVVPWRVDFCDVEYTDLYTYTATPDVTYGEWHPRKMNWRPECHFSTGMQYTF